MWGNWGFASPGISQVHKTTVKKPRQMKHEESSVKLDTPSDQNKLEVSEVERTLFHRSET
eukprot:3381676-Amphidinium_carterae.3